MITFNRLLLTALLAVAAFAPAQAAPAKPQHVFVIVLENKGYENSFGATAGSPYLAQTLPAQGQLLTQYYGIGHASLDNYIAMVSGQAPNLETQTDCVLYSSFVMVERLFGQAVGQGCVYPRGVAMVGDQLEAAGLNWKAYAEDLDDGVTHACRHPQLNRRDTTQSATATNQYATRHEPFLYFRSVIDDAPRCAAHVVDLAALDADLAQTASTPNLAFITPDLCSDGHDAPCADGRPGGYASIDAFLRTWVPKITGSPAFQKDGLLVVLFDEAEPVGGDRRGANAACCGERAGFNTLLPGLYGPGGGRTGAVLVSPFILPGSVNATPFNHYALLKSIEDLFGLSYLGFAAQSGLQAFDGSVYNGH